MALAEIGQGIGIEVGSKALGVTFTYHPFIDHSRSKQEGRPIYQDVEMIEIRIPGSRDVLIRNVTEEDKVIYSRLYDHFKAKNTAMIDGTPLTEFPFITAADRKELEYFNVYTAEQIVSISDTHMDKMRVNIRDLIKKIKAHMQNAKDTAFVTHVTQENEDLKRRIAFLETQLNDVINKLGKEDDAQGRKRKAA